MADYIILGLAIIGIAGGIFLIIKILRAYKPMPKLRSSGKGEVEKTHQACVQTAKQEIPRVTREEFFGLPLRKGGGCPVCHGTSVYYRNPQTGICTCGDDKCGAKFIIITGYE